MSPPTIGSGLTGTLSPEEYTTKTVPYWGQPYLAGTACYRDIDYVSIAFTTDANKAAALLPTKLALIPIPGLPGQSAASLVFAKYRECDLGPTWR